MIRLLALSTCLLLSGNAVLSEEMPMSESRKISQSLVERVEAEGVVRVIVQVRASSAEELSAAGPSTRGLCANEECAKLQLQQTLPATEFLGVSQLLGNVGGQRLLDLLGAHSVQIRAVGQIVHDRFQLHAVRFGQHLNDFFVRGSHDRLRSERISFSSC